MEQNLSRPTFSRKFPVPGFPSSLIGAFRLLEDINQTHAKTIARQTRCDAARILEIGYGVMTHGALRSLRSLGPVPKFVKSGLIVIPCRDIHGKVVALHDENLRWITAPTIHIANPRAQRAEIQALETTIEADCLALSENVCAIARNGCDNNLVAVALAVLKGDSQQGRLAA